MKLLIHFAALAIVALMPFEVARAQTDAPIPVESVSLRLIEQADVPARQAGVLASVEVREGQVVKDGDELARIDDVEADLAVQKAMEDLEVARIEAENDVDIRYSRKSNEVDRAELQRALDAVAKFRNSVSQTELDALKLKVERSTLEIEQAQRTQQIASHLHRLKENELTLARRIAERHRITSPVNGMVVQVNRRRGEWVEPGEKVFRVVRTDQLRAQGFVNLRDVRGDLKGRPVKLTVALPGETRGEFSGKVVFVSPEVDPVNKQVLIFAEIDNPDLVLRAGLAAQMTILRSAPAP
jgi:RND family efflux transporter MFP subunit